MSPDYRVIQFTDPHLSRPDEISFSQLFSKRILGYFNLRFKRLQQHSNELADEAIQKVKQLNPNHVMVTGDLSNLAFSFEYDEVLRWLSPLELKPEEITVLPGNHDAYVKEVWPEGPFWEKMKGFCLSDEGWSSQTDLRFPVVRDRQSVRIIGISTAIPSPPFCAWGRVGKKQLLLVERALREGWQKGKTCLLGMHHPPQIGVTRLDNGLRDGDSFRKVIRRVGASVVIHGHMHRSMIGNLMGPGGVFVPVYGTGSTSLRGLEGQGSAEFRVLDFGKQGLQRTVVYSYDREKKEFIKSLQGSFGD